MILRNILSSWARMLPARNIIASRFSTYFEEKDKLELQKLTPGRLIYKPYQKMVDLWKKPLEKKRLRQARIRQIKATKQVPQPQEVKFVVHNPVFGIQASPEVFCVVLIKASQFKITEGCTIVLDHHPQMKVGQQVTFDKVMLIGAKDFTVLGRPFVGSASVKAVVEEQTMSKKIIVLKKKRRKNYRRNMGFNTPLTVVRITKIDFKITDDLLQKAVALQ